MLWSFLLLFYDLQACELALEVLACEALACLLARLFVACEVLCLRCSWLRASRFRLFSKPAAAPQLNATQRNPTQLKYYLQYKSCRIFLSLHNYLTTSFLWGLLARSSERTGGVLY